MKNTKRVHKYEMGKTLTSITRNKGIQGDTIEIMMERLREGEGEDSVADRDLVYNDNETDKINPITNIRTDKMETMLEEKIGEYAHKHRKLKVVKDEPKEENETDVSELEG